jgi:division protein CdvB (Snf7/Vps24/ESCRT-III family)
LKPIFQKTSDLKINLRTAVKQLKLQVQKVDEENNLLAQKLKETALAFADYDAKKDFARANVCGCLLAENVAIMKKFVQVRLALEKTTMMMSEVPEPFKSVDTMATSIEVLRRVRTMVECPMPMVEQKLGEVELLLDQTVATALCGSDTKINTQMAEQSAEEIMKNAYKEAESEVATKFSSTFTQIVGHV